MTDLLDQLADLDLPDDVEVLPRRTRVHRTARRLAMRPRKIVVKAHRWLSIALMAWLFVVAASGAWLVTHHTVERWLHQNRFVHTSGDLGMQAAVDSAMKAIRKDSTVDYVTTPANAHGIYIVNTEHPVKGHKNPDKAIYEQIFVNPGTAKVNSVHDYEAGLDNWIYRGHEFLWQDNGLFGAFAPGSGWCTPTSKGIEPGGVKGVACDVLPDGGDMVSWFAVGWMVVLVTGFYLWYWPGVKRWATAFTVKRGRGKFTFNLSLHKVIGVIVWAPLLMITFTGAAFAFPNLNKWYENVTPAHRDFELWSAPDDLASGKAKGRTPLDYDEVQRILHERYPERRLEGMTPPADETGTYTGWVTRGFSPWSRTEGAGNVYFAIDQYSGKTLYDGRPDEGNVWDQLWDDYSFPLHTGDVFTTPTRLLWTGFALSPFLLGITGVTMNLVRRKKRANRVEVSA